MLVDEIKHTVETFVFPVEEPQIGVYVPCPFECIIGIVVAVVTVVVIVAVVVIIYIKKNRPSTGVTH